MLVIIGKSTGRYLPVDQALDHVFGYAAMDEACLGDYPFHTRQINPGSSHAPQGSSTLRRLKSASRKASGLSAFSIQRWSSRRA